MNEALSKIGELLSPERFQDWIAKQEAGRIGFTADAWNCPLAYYLSDSLGMGDLAAEVSEDGIQLRDGTTYQLDRFSWPHHFVVGIDAIDPFTKKFAVTREHALACLERAIKAAKDWGAIKSGIVEREVIEVEEEEYYDDEDEYDERYDMDKVYGTYPFDEEDDWT